MRSQMMWIRILTATVLFVVLSKVNLWADTRAHLVLAVGYRALLVLAPVLLVLGVGGAMRLSLAVATIGLIWAIFSVDVGSMFLIALGMAVSGYLAKLISSQSSRGAADNKVSLNLGSLASGGLLLLISGQKPLLWVSIFCVGFSFFLAMRIDWASEGGFLDRGGSGARKTPMQAGRLVGWGLIGLATGVKLTGVFTILPQYLMAKTGALPSWFGIMVITNSVGVIVVQHRIMEWLDRKSPMTTFLTAGSAMVLLALPGVFQVERPLLSLLWISLLTLGECALSRYDRLAQGAGYLFTKELTVGVGSLLTVLLSRNHALDAMWSGVLGTAAFMAGVALISVQWGASGATRSWSAVVPDTFHRRYRLLQ
jgi:hypothetical protein